MVDDYHQETWIIWRNAAAEKAKACFPISQLPLKFER